MSTKSAEPSAELTPGRVPGEVGVWVFLFGDMCVFALLFGVFVYYRDKTPHAFTAAQTHLHSIFGLANTLLLLSSSLAVVLSVRAMRTGAMERARRLIPFAMACGVVFLVDKGLEWSDLVRHHHGPSGNDFFTYFFVLTGIHALHVIIGLAVLTALLVISRRPKLTRATRIFVEGGACFWHMVDLLWIVLFALLYLAH